MAKAQSWRRARASTAAGRRRPSALSRWRISWKPPAMPTRARARPSRSSSRCRNRSATAPNLWKRSRARADWRGRRRAIARSTRPTRHARAGVSSVRHAAVGGAMAAWTSRATSAIRWWPSRAVPWWCVRTTRQPAIPCMCGTTMARSPSTSTWTGSACAMGSAWRPGSRSAPWGVPAIRRPRAIPICISSYGAMAVRSIRCRCCAAPSAMLPCPHARPRPRCCATAHRVPQCANCSSSSTSWATTAPMAGRWRRPRESSGRRPNMPCAHSRRTTG